MISLNGASKSFFNQKVLNPTSLVIQKGECLVLIGPSGMGKTVLLKLMSGLILPDQGKVTVDGVNWAESSNEDINRLLKKIGMLFQKNALFDSFTCGENVAFPIRELGKKSELEIQSTVDAFLNKVGIPHAKNLYPDEISGGMQKRLGIARALALDPEIIFYDDPTAGLDPITSKKIIELIIELKKQKGSTVVAITNDMNRAYQMADRIAMVVDKEVILTGTPEETKASSDPKVQQFIQGLSVGPLTGAG